jgi:hypothetical protein
MSAVSCIMALRVQEIQAYKHKKLSSSDCCILYLKCTKTHLHACVLQKIFPGAKPPTPKSNIRGDRGRGRWGKGATGDGGGRGGKKREEEGKGRGGEGRGGEGRGGEGRGGDH